MICGCNRNRNCCARFVENGCASKEDIIRLRTTLDKQNNNTDSAITNLSLKKQDKLTAGENITIDMNNVISAASAIEYTAGQGIDIDENEISLKKESVDVIFPTYEMDGGDTLGDCSIIKTPNKVIMIDTFENSENTFRGITKALQENNIDRIDYLIISHYHSDHYKNYARLISSGLINRARIILPREAHSATINMTGDDIKNALRDAGLQWEQAENETIEIERGINMRLFNASAEDYEYYNNNTENYNNYCICTEIEAYGKRMLFVGDCIDTALSYIANKYLTGSGYDLLKDSHHGLTAFEPDFYKKVCPKNVLVPTSMGMVKKNIGRNGTLLNAWGLCTSSIYFQGGQDTAVVFSVSRENVSVTSDVFSVQEPGSGGTWNFYLDSTTTDQIRTGSRSHPFKNLAEANVMMPKNSQATLNLNVLNLGTETDTVLFRGFNNLIVRFNNNTPSCPIEFQYCKNILLTNVVLESTDIKIIRCPAVFLSNISSSASMQRQLTIEECSNVKIEGRLSSTNAINYFLRLAYSNVSFNVSSLNFSKTSGSTKIFEGWGSKIVFNKSFLDILKQYPLTGTIMGAPCIRENNINALEELGTLFDSNVAVYDGITLKESIQNYSKVKIYSETIDGYSIVNEYPIYNPGGQNLFLVESTLLDNGAASLYHKTARFVLSGVTATTDRQGQITTDTSTGDITSLITDNQIGIRKIVGVI